MFDVIEYIKDLERRVELLERAAPSVTAEASVAWGLIIGSIEDQTDLDTALDGKSPVGHEHAVSAITDFEDEVIDAYNTSVPAASQAEAEAGTESEIRRWSPLRIKNAVKALAEIDYSINPFPLIDDFRAGSTESGEVGELGWAHANSTLYNFTGEEDHPGIVRLRSTNSAGTISHMTLPSHGDSNPSSVYNSFLENEFILKLESSGSDNSLRVGLIPTPQLSTIPAGIYFERLGSDTNWQCVNAHQDLSYVTTYTKADSGVPASTNWVRLKIKIDYSTDTVKFYINGSLVATNSTNIPIADFQTYVAVQLTPEVSSYQYIRLDYFCAKFATMSR